MVDNPSPQPEPDWAALEAEHRARADAAQFVDFDQAWSETGPPAATFKAFGQTWTLPAEPPVKLILAAVRKMQDGADVADDITPDEMVDLLSAFMGRATIERLLDEGVTNTQLEDVMRYCLSVYQQTGSGGGVSPPEQEGAAAEFGLPSSNIGGHSKPTGNVNTVGTSQPTLTED